MDMDNSVGTAWGSGWWGWMETGKWEHWDNCNSINNKILSKKKKKHWICQIWSYFFWLLRLMMTSPISEEHNNFKQIQGRGNRVWGKVSFTPKWRRENVLVILYCSNLQYIVVETFKNPIFHSSVNSQNYIWFFLLED